MTIFIYIYINYLNSSLVDNKVETKIRIKVIKLKIVKLALLRALLPYLVILLGIESLFSLLKITKLYKRFF